MKKPITIIYQMPEDDYVAWSFDIEEHDLDSIFTKYETDGCSVSGKKLEEVLEDLKKEGDN